MGTLWVVGDSTLSSFADKYFYPRYGYGTMLAEYLDDRIKVENLALSGRSSKSYTDEPQYQTLLQGMQEGDFLLIGFGHNDEKAEAGRFTDSVGDYRTEGSFAHSLYTNYITPAIKKGCRPIVATSIVRRTKTGIWSDADLHVTKSQDGFPGGSYPEAVKKLSADLKEKEGIVLPVCDMTARTKALYEELGPEGTICLHAWTSANPVSVDNTHTNIYGARVNAYLLLRDLKEQGIEGLSEHICRLDQDAPLPDRAKYLVENKEYTPAVFSDDLRESAYWKSFTDTAGNVFYGTAFGDILTEPDQFADCFVMEPCDGALRMAAKNNMGKIGDINDGIAMYYIKLPADQKFRLTAKVKINDYFLNDQVSFGLMVRDDMYIDCRTADVLGDYVAAAPLLLTRGEKAVNCFARKSGVLTYGGEMSRSYEPGDVAELSLCGTQDGYAARFGQEKEITGGFDFRLTAVDPEHVYAGMFVSRNADVTFTDVKLERID